MTLHAKSSHCLCSLSKYHMWLRPLFHFQTHIRPSILPKKPETNVGLFLLGCLARDCEEGPMCDLIEFDLVGCT